MTTPDTDRARIVERLREPDYHDPACPFKKHCYCDDEGSHDRVSHPQALELAALIEQDGRTIEALRAEIARQREVIDGDRSREHLIPGHP